MNIMEYELIISKEKTYYFKYFLSVWKDMMLRKDPNMKIISEINGNVKKKPEVSIKSKFKSKFEKKIDIVSQKVKQKEDLKSMDYSIKEGSAFSVMAGFGQNYLSAFAIALNATNTHLAFLSSLPGLVANYFQPLGIKIAELKQTRKEVILHTVLAQAFIWIPLFILPLLFKDYSLWFLITFVVLYHMLSALHTPLWGSMMTDIVTQDQRGRYFGKRNKIIGGVAFGSEISAGLILFLFENINIWVGFGILFFIACIGRIVSYTYMKKIYEPEFKFQKKKQFTIIEFIKSLRNTNYGRFVFATSLLRFSVNVASPFFTAFILRDLGYSYLQYTIIISASTVASFMTMYYWGKHSDTHGHKKIMTVTSWLIPLIPLCWALTTNFYVILAMQFLSGTAWAGFQLAEQNYLYDAVYPERRMRGIAYHNLFKSKLIFLGSLTGAGLSSYLPSISLPSISFQASSLQVVFFISALLRACAVIFYMPMFKQLKETKVQKKDHEVFIDLIAVRPISGLIITTRAHANSVVNVLDKGKKKIGSKVERMVDSGLSTMEGIIGVKQKKQDNNVVTIKGDIDIKLNRKKQS